MGGIYGRGYGVADEVRVSTMSNMADTAMPTLAVAFSLTNVAGESDSDYSSNVDGATIAIAAGASVPTITLTIQKVDADGNATTDSTTTIDCSTTTTLKGVIDAINAVDGFTAWALHAPHNMNCNQANFITLTETQIRTDGKPLECLYRDVDAFTVDSDYINYLRVGNPTERDSGRMKIIRVEGTVTAANNGSITLYRDVYGGTLTTLHTTALSAGLNTPIDEDAMTGMVVQGPILLAVNSDNAADLVLSNFRVITQQVEF